MRLLVILAATACATAPVARLPAAALDEPPHPSSGCGPPGKAVQRDRTLTSGGRTRRFRLFVPSSALQKPAPLVLNLHGLVETAEMQQFYSAMNAAAAERGIIVAYPQGAMNSWNAGECCGRAQDEKIDDVRFLEDLVRELQSELCIDRARIYATGMSNGAIMSYRLACEASDVFAAVSPVDGVEAIESCPQRRAVPILSFNGTSDPLVRYRSGWFGLHSALETAARIAARYHCGKERTVVFQNGDTTCEAPKACDADLISCRIEGGGHTWPGAFPVLFLGHTSKDVDATRTMLDFFLQHPLSKAHLEPPPQR